MANEAALTKVQAAAPSVEVEVTEDVATRQIVKRATNVCNSSSLRSYIDAAYSEGRQLASVAASYISSRGTGDSLYRSYWGTNSASTVGGVFNRVVSGGSST